MGKTKLVLLVVAFSALQVAGCGKGAPDLARARDRRAELDELASRLAAALDACLT